MSTLDPRGMVGAYKVNRPLNDSEKRHRFDVSKPCSQKPHYELSLIKLNSTFVECVDKWYSMRGFVAMGGFALAGVVIAGLLLVGDILLNPEYFLPASAVAILGISLLAASLYLLTRDAFTYTHYPIRFNRQNRQVYVFRRDGTVLKAGWKDICWTIYGQGVAANEGYVMGHILSDDKKTYWHLRHPGRNKSTVSSASSDHPPQRDRPLGGWREQCVPGTHDPSGPTPGSRSVLG